MSETTAAEELHAATPAATPVVFSMTGERLPNVDASRVAAYNFRSPGFLADADLRQINTLYGRFVTSLSARLSTFVRMECIVKVLEVKSSPFASFCADLPESGHHILFQVEPLRGVGIVELPISLGLAMTDRLLGGKGRVVASDRGLTEIERALVEDAVRVLVSEWTALWDLDGESKTQILGHETNGRFLKTSAPDAVCLVGKFELTIGEMAVPLHIAVPFSMVEAPVKQMQTARRVGEPTQKQPKWRTPFEGIAVPVTAEWDVCEITLGDVSRWNVGDVLPLSRDLVAQTRVRLSNKDEFTGAAGVQNGRIAVQLTQRALSN